MQNNKALPPAIALFGPTACGKTDLALKISREWPVEVISVDSALIYRDMNIGTAKPDAEFLRELPHHLVDILDPDQPYSAAEFRRDALQLMQAITERGRIPLLVGGTMLYFKVLIEGMADLPATDPAIRRQVSEQAAELGWPAMHAQLAEIDPQTAAVLHPNHSQRIQRALEVYLGSGETLSAIQARQAQQPLPYNLLQLALWPQDRTDLHARIAQRFEQMLAQGFLQEVIELRERYPLNADMMSMRAVGYRQAWAHLEGEYDAVEMTHRGIAATRQLAKRQLTWLRKWPNIVQLPVNFRQNDPLEGLLVEVSRQIKAL